MQSQARQGGRGGRRSTTLILTAQPPPDPELRYAALCGKGDNLLVLGRKEPDAARTPRSPSSTQLAALPDVTAGLAQPGALQKGRALEQLNRQPEALTALLRRARPDRCRRRANIFWYYKAGFDARAHLREAGESGNPRSAFTKRWRASKARAPPRPSGGVEGLAARSISSGSERGAFAVILRLQIAAFAMKNPRPSRRRAAASTNSPNTETHIRHGSQALHSRSRPSLRKNLRRLLPADDRPPQRRFQKALRRRSIRGCRSSSARSSRCFFPPRRAWGVMEGAIRNLVGSGKVLNCMCGAFSDKWLDVSKKLRQAGRGAAGRVGPADPRRADSREARRQADSTRSRSSTTKPRPA